MNEYVERGHPALGRHLQEQGQAEQPFLHPDLPLDAALRYVNQTELFRW